MSSGTGRWRLDGRKALVTGGTLGIGRAVADELASLGAQVSVVARRVPEGEFPHRLLIADVSEPGAAGRIVDDAVDQCGGLDILVNNVGTNHRVASVSYPKDAYDRLFSVNVESAWELCRAAHPYLRESASGSIVQVGSVAGSGYVGSGAPYAMTKAALDQLTRYLAVEWAPDGMRVNSVNPWYTRTPLAQPILDDPAWLNRILAATPSGRVADPEDIASVVAFLCLPASRHVSGTCLAVDGGFLARAL